MDKINLLILKELQQIKELLKEDKNIKVNKYRVQRPIIERLWVR